MLGAGLKWISEMTGEERCAVSTGVGVGDGARLIYIICVCQILYKMENREPA